MLITASSFPGPTIITSLATELTQIVIVESILITLPLIILQVTLPRIMRKESPSTDPAITISQVILPRITSNIMESASTDPAITISQVIQPRIIIMESTSTAIAISVPTIV